MVIFTARQNLANLNEVKMNSDCHICEFGREILYFPRFKWFYIRSGLYYKTVKLQIIQIMHIREVVSKNYSPRSNFIKVWNTRGWKPSVFWIFIKLPRVDNFTNDRSPNVHYFFYIKWFQKSKRSLVKSNARSRHSSITHRIYMTILYLKKIYA